MASIGQLLISGQGAKSRRDIELAQEQEMARRERASKAGGWGRALGFGGSFLATLGMANPITAAAITGLGALAGRSAGRALYGGREQDANKNINTDFYQGAQRDFKKEIGNYQKGMRERMVMDTGRDMFSAYNLGKAMDPLARNTGIGGDRYAEKVTEQGLRDNPWLNQTDDEFWASVGDSQVASAGPVVSAPSNPINNSLLNLVESSNSGTPVLNPGLPTTTSPTTNLNAQPYDPFASYNTTNYAADRAGYSISPYGYH